MVQGLRVGVNLRPKQIPRSEGLFVWTLLPRQVTFCLMDQLARRYADLKSKISQAAESFGHDPAKMRLLAVSKTHSVSKIRALYHLGQRDFGENYAQELALKAQELRGAGDCLDLKFSFIGTLQSNKIRGIVTDAVEIQTLCQTKHAEVINRVAHELGKTPYPVWIAVNAGSEVSKSGVTMADTPSLASTIVQQFPHLNLMGIMSIPPPLSPSEHLQKNPPPLYRKLADLARQTGQGQLSLGMSDDLVHAIASGSQCVRIGTALFGPRGS